jgi:hypothetical protein
MEVAARTLTMQNGASNLPIPILIFPPVQQKADAWSCQYQIGWPEGKEIREIWGVDSMQAIFLALQAIGSDIYTSSYHQNGSLFFEEPGKGYGFPVPSGLRDLLVGDDEKYL